MRLPHFIPILTAFTARVADCEMTGLLEAPTALARALANTQTVVGHDGVLCVYDPSLLFSACSGQQKQGIPDGHMNEFMLTPADKIVRAAPLVTLLEAIEPLRYQLPDSAVIFTAFAGPGLLWTQLQDFFDSSGLDEKADPEYVVSVVRNAVRSSLEMKADGVALIEHMTPECPSKLRRAHKAVRKLADFFDAGFIVFRQPGCDTDLPASAHCVFDLAATGVIGPVTGRTTQSADPGYPQLTTAGDVPANTAVDELKSLTAAARC